MKANIFTIDHCLLPLSVFALINLTAIASLGAEKEKDKSGQQNQTETITQPEKIEQSQAITTLYQAESWLIAPEYKINSQLKPQEAIDWENIKIEFDPELELNL
ncbi:MAG: hypothetical protein HC930_10780 [Hydrococcus sp. SU_1_0]|nr:hypothetical protein [Hydrococcus sp. SU_1_0]